MRKIHFDYFTLNYNQYMQERYHLRVVVAKALIQVISFGYMLFLSFQKSIRT